MSRARLPIGAVVVTAAMAARALPPRGAELPAFRVTTPDDVALTQASAAGRPLLVVYEDKGSQEKNRAFKEALAVASKGAPWAKRYTLAPIADVAGYDYWPVRSFVKGAVRAEEKRSGVAIYCDWSGAAREAFQVREGTSTVLLYGRDGRLLRAVEGPIEGAARSDLLEALRRASAEADEASGPAAAK